MRISVLENEVKRLEDKVQVLEKVQSDFEDKLERNLKVKKVTAKCVWVKSHDDQKAFLKQKSNIIKVVQTE